MRARIFSGQLTQIGQLCAKCKTFKFSPQFRWKIRACGTGREFAEYDHLFPFTANKDFFQLSNNYPGNLLHIVLLINVTANQ